MEMQFRLKHSLKKIFSRVFANGTSKGNRGLAFEVTMLLFKAHHGHEQCHYLNMNYIWGFWHCSIVVVTPKATHQELQNERLQLKSIVPPHISAAVSACSALFWCNISWHNSFQWLKWCPRPACRRSSHSTPERLSGSLDDYKNWNIRSFLSGDDDDDCW